ncbi:NhaC family Na+:H+ antiporter [Bacillus pakistanensis]|uniref:NhaC family Na+:H+ antiporter n=1 Tax=Rossellomorea pakistanensis TaxID=992288 RepID=A0ABS2NFF1_9BACI|nr:Na+/H+ antiporter NhaC [Bacillus pakistanensis]MBM7586588.1 NhaC family Na+:H+ antiporter [Bacillus pakistanensis]
MFTIEPVHKPKMTETLLMMLAIIALISISIIKWGAVPHIPILFSIFLLLLFGAVKRVSFKELESGMLAGAQSGLGAVFLFFMIGILISSWMVGGTIPTLMFLGFELVTPKFFYSIAFLITSIVGIAVGSSLTTAATIGVALIGVGEALGVSLPLTAGAIVSGAFFGDKMSPLSDTTNLASAIVKVDLFEHIKNMSWTTIPAFILTFIIFLFLSPSEMSSNLTELITIKDGLEKTNLIHWYSLLPVILLIFLTIRKFSSFITLALSSCVAILISFFHDQMNIRNLFSVLFNGYQSDTGLKAVDSLLTRGGVNSMMFTIALVLLSLALGGLLFKLGIIPVLFEKVSHRLKKVKTVIIATVTSAIGINVLIGEQYLSILLTGEAFQDQYRKVGLHPKNLSRALEDGGTVINPLVPWSVCGIFLTDVLGVPTLSYLPFAFFCILSPLLTILFGITGWTITRIDSTAKEIK